MKINTLLAALLATAASASFAAAPATRHDPASYRNVTQKAAADYKAAVAACKDMAGNAKVVCVDEAKAVRAHAEADAVVQYNDSVKARAKANSAAVEADFALAKAKCADAAGAEKTSCIGNATALHATAVENVRADRAISASTVATTTDTISPVTTTATRDATKSAAVDECAQVSGAPKTGCLIDHKKRGATAVAATAAGTATVADRTANATANAVDRTASATARAVERTDRAMDHAADKSRDAAATVAAKTERTADKVAATSQRAAAKTGAAVADSVITTKVKAEIFKEPALKSLALHVETEHGVVMLSGFVDSKANADRAVAVAKSVEGVASVKSAVKVK